MDSVRTGFVNQPGIDPDTAIPAAEEMGCDFVEIIMDGPTERRRLEETRERLTSLADEAGITLLFHLPWALDIGSPLEQVQEGAIRELQACLDTAAAFNGEKAVIHAASDAWSSWDYSTVQETILRAVQELDGYAEGSGVEVCVENVPGGFFDTLDFDRLFQETAASMCFDTGHAVRDGMDVHEMAAFIEAYPDRVSHIHLNDVMVGEIEHIPFGSGTVDFEALFSRLKESDWGGTMSLEPFTYSLDYIRYSKEHLDSLL